MPPTKSTSSQLASQAVNPVDSRTLMRYLGSHLRLTHFAAIAALESAFAPYGGTPTRFALLVHVQELPGATQTQLAELLATDRTTLVPILAGMERKGQIRRTRSETDRRATRIWLTPTGEVLLSQLKPIAAAVDRKICAAMSPADKQRVIRLLAAIRRSLKT